MKKSSTIILTFMIATCLLLPSGMIVSANMKSLSNSKSIGEQKKAPFETDKFKQEKEVAKANRAQKDKVAPISPNVSPIENEVALGIINDTESMDFTIVSQNVWVGKVDGNIVRIYAGSEKEDKEQSVISVVTESPDQSIKIKKYKPSKKEGSLKIISEENDHLIIESNNGKKYNFGKKTHEIKEK